MGHSIEVGNKETFIICLLGLDPNTTKRSQFIDPLLRTIRIMDLRFAGLSFRQPCSGVNGKLDNTIVLNDGKTFVLGGRVVFGT